MNIIKQKNVEGYMFVWSVKASTLKFIAVLLVSAAAIGAFAVFMPKYELKAAAASAA